DLEVLLLRRTAGSEHLGRGLEREELRQRSQRGRGADAFEEGAPRRILRKHRAHHGGRDDVLVALLLALDGGALQRRRSVALMLDLADVTAAGATGAVQPMLRIERIVEHGHERAPSVTPPVGGGALNFAMAVPSPWV